MKDGKGVYAGFLERLGATVIDKRPWNQTLKEEYAQYEK